MKTVEEIFAAPRVSVQGVRDDGGYGVIGMPTWQGSVIWSTGGGWDHVSVAPFKHRIIPSWSDMCTIKDIFFSDEEAVIQIHPPKSQYVNNMSNCLHLWRYQADLPLPPSIMVGVYDGQTMASVLKELTEVLNK